MYDLYVFFEKYIEYRFLHIGVAYSTNTEKGQTIQPFKKRAVMMQHNALLPTALPYGPAEAARNNMRRKALKASLLSIL
jgi:hypothetical protein